MAPDARPLTLGLPRMHKEAGERRDFLPPFVGRMAELGLEVFVESTIGSGMGYHDQDYLGLSPRIHAVGNLEAMKQDLVLVLRCPELEELDALRRRATLISMIHFPTRPRRRRRLRALALEAISLESVVDDQGRRLVENLTAVAWNGLEAAFDALETTDPRANDPGRPPVRVTILGTGVIGKQSVEAAVKCGRLERAEAFHRAGRAGVEVLSIGRDLTEHEPYMRQCLARTDILVDATQRRDPTMPVVPNAWIAELPAHAVICDLAVDPYILAVDPPTVRGIEGIPLGNLDRRCFAPDDPDWSRTVPAEVSQVERRTVVSCYSWPGVHPEPCMERYGHQIEPLMQTLVARGGVPGLRSDGDDLERALWRGSLRAWRESP